MLNINFFVQPLGRPLTHSLRLSRPLKQKKIKCHTRNPQKSVSFSSHSGSLIAPSIIDSMFEQSSVPRFHRDRVICAVMFAHKSGRSMSCPKLNCLHNVLAANKYNAL